MLFGVEDLLFELPVVLEDPDFLELPDDFTPELEPVDFVPDDRDVVWKDRLLELLLDDPDFFW